MSFSRAVRIFWHFYEADSDASSWQLLSLRAGNDSRQGDVELKLIVTT